MSGAPAETLAVLALVVTLLFAVLRPRGLSESVVAVPAAALVVLTGTVGWHRALDRIETIGPTVGFLAAILVFGHLCAEAGVFDYLGGRAASMSSGRPRRLLAVLVALAAAVTAVLTLDATVVLLTPVVLTTVRRLGVPARPHLYATTRLANSGSLLLPVSNLTNLLAFSSSGLSFGKFSALMLVPWIVVVVGEWGTLRLWFRGDLPARVPERDTEPSPAPRYALVVLLLTVVAFVACSSLDVQPAWAALGGCLVMLAPRWREARPVRLVNEAGPGFCIFVLALAVVVDGVTRHGLGDLLQNLIPAGDGLPVLLAVTLLAAVLANLVNNLPATLALVPLVEGRPAVLLAVLIGVNVGPNATYVGSLATLLWRRLLPADLKPDARQFHAVGLATVPVLMAAATAALWCAVQVVGA